MFWSNKKNAIVLFYLPFAMWLKTYRPYTPSRRYIIGYDFSDITKKTPEKSLTIWLPAKSWRNNQGRITSRFRWGRHKRLYRLIDRKGYTKINIPGKVASIEYDPFRTARIALIHYVDGEKRYVLARKWCTVGAQIMTGSSAPVAPGNRKQLKDIPEWLTVYNIEFTPFTKGKIVKSAWSFATITGRDEKWFVLLKLPSGEIRKFDEKCWATIGQVGNEDHKNIVVGKAGRQRRLGKKPHVLGKSMNPVDHPHGWWEGHTSIGLKYPKSPTGRNVAPGIKTRSKKKRSNTMIVARRKAKKVASK